MLVSFTIASRFLDGGKVNVTEIVKCVIPTLTPVPIRKVLIWWKKCSFPQGIQCSLNKGHLYICRDIDAGHRSPPTRQLCYWQVPRKIQKPLLEILETRVQFPLKRLSSLIYVLFLNSIALFENYSLYWLIPIGTTVVKYHAEFSGSRIPRTPFKKKHFMTDYLTRVSTWFILSMYFNIITPKIS